MDAVGVLDDLALRGLAEHLGQAHRGQRLPRPEIAQDRAGADRGQLVGVAHEQELRAVGDGLQQVVEEDDVDHRGLVDDDQVGLELAVGVALEEALLRAELEEPVQRLGGATGGLGEPLRGAAGGGGEAGPIGRAHAAGARGRGQAWSCPRPGRR